MQKSELVELLRGTHKKMLLSKAETANELNVSEATLDRLRQSGKLNSKKVLGQVMFAIDEVANFIREA